MTPKIDNKTFEAMYKDFERLVEWAANRYGVAQIPLDDRRQAARIGFWRAAQKYNDKLGMKFSSYAARWMRWQIRKTLDSEGFIPRSYDLNGMDSLTVSFDPTPEEIVISNEEAKRLIATADGVRRIRQRFNRKSESNNTFTATDIATMLDSGLTKSQIARKLGVSRQRIGQIVADICTERKGE